MIKNRITLKQLEAFVSAIDTGSFRRAAVVLGTTQPNISNRIATLEASLGTPLMQRDAGSLRQTERGTDLLEEARNVLRATEHLLEVADRRDLIEDRLRLGVTELVACTWLQAYLGAFRKSYPNVSVELQVDLSAQIEDRLSAGELDLALQTGPFTRKMTGEAHLGDYAYIWVAAPRLAQQIGRSPDLADLFAHSILTHARDTVAVRELLDMQRQAHLPVNRIVHSSSLAACVPMALEGMGVALLPRALVADDLRTRRLVAIDCDWHPSPLAFYARFDARKAAGYVQFAADLAGRIARSQSDKFS